MKSKSRSAVRSSGGKRDASGKKHRVTYSIESAPAHVVPKVAPAKPKSERKAWRWNIDYDNDALPDVRLPMSWSVPDHLVDEFSELFRDNRDDDSGDASGKKRKSGSDRFQSNKKFKIQPWRKLVGLPKRYMEYMEPFWTADRIKTMIEVIMKLTETTLSVMDWACVSFSKSVPVRYPLNGTPDFDMRQSYCSHLDVYERPYFDAFCRGPRVLVEAYIPDLPLKTNRSGEEIVWWDTKKTVGARMVAGKKMVYLVTSISQLVFFKWAIEHGVVDYCRENNAVIDAHMKATKNAEPSVPGKRRKLSVEADVTYYVSEGPIVIKYDTAQYDSPESCIMTPEKEERLAGLGFAKVLEQWKALPDGPEKGSREQLLCAVYEDWKLLVEDGEEAAAERLDAWKKDMLAFLASSSGCTQYFM
jgi:hypothetical protein